MLSRTSSSNSQPVEIPRLNARAEGSPGQAVLTAEGTQSVVHANCSTGCDPMQHGPELGIGHSLVADAGGLRGAFGRLELHVAPGWPGPKTVQE